MSVEDLHVGHADDITLLSSSVDEVGRCARRSESFRDNRLRTRQSMRNPDIRVAIDIALHAVASSIDIESGELRVGRDELVGLVEQSLIYACKHIALEVDGDVTAYSASLIAAAIDIAANISTINYGWGELAVYIQLDERINRLGKTKEVAAFVIDFVLTALPDVVCVVASAHYLVGDGKTIWERVFKDIAFLLAVSLRIDVHVSTVSSAEE